MSHSDVRFGHPVRHPNVTRTCEFIDPPNPYAYNAVAIVRREGAAVGPVATKIVLSLHHKFAQEQADVPVNASTRGFDETTFGEA